MPQYYKTTFTVQFLSVDMNPADWDLKDAMIAAESEALSGDVLTVECSEVTPEEMAELLTRQGSDPALLGLS